MTKKRAEALGIVVLPALFAWAIAWWFKGRLLEIPAVGTGVAGVYLMARGSVWNFPIGLVNVSLYFYLFMQDRLFGDMTLQAVYFVLLLAGWYSWSKTGSSRSTTVTRATNKDIAVLSAVFLAGSASLSVFLANVHDPAPVLDASTTIGSLLAQVMFNKRLIQNWLVWIAVDIVYVPMYVMRGFHSTAILYAVFLILAVLGYRQWSALEKEGPDRDSVEAV